MMRSGVESSARRAHLVHLVVRRGGLYTRHRRAYGCEEGFVHHENAVWSNGTARVAMSDSRAQLQTSLGGENRHLSRGKVETTVCGHVIMCTGTRPHRSSSANWLGAEQSTFPRSFYSFSSHTPLAQRSRLATRPCASTTRRRLESTRPTTHRSLSRRSKHTPLPPRGLIEARLSRWPTLRPFPVARSAACRTPTSTARWFWFAWTTTA